MLQVSLLMWSVNMSLDDPTEISPGNRRNRLTGILHLVEPDVRHLLWLTQEQPLDKGQHWFLWAGPGTPLGGWHRDPLLSEQGLGVSWKNCSELELSRRLTLGGVNAVLLWSPETQKSCRAHNIRSFPNSAASTRQPPFEKSVSCVSLLTSMKQMLL